MICVSYDVGGTLIGITLVNCKPEMESSVVKCEEAEPVLSIVNNNCYENHNW